jgi:hypothetical protein
MGVLPWVFSATLKKWVDSRTDNPVRAFKISIELADYSIPWQVAEEAFKEYQERFTDMSSLEEVERSGGFGAAELALLLYERVKRVEQEKDKPC